VNAWSPAFSQALVAVAWIGHDEPRSLGQRESGGGLALPIWIDYMAQALKGVAGGATARAARRPAAQRWRLALQRVGEAGGGLDRGGRGGASAGRAGVRRGRAADAGQRRRLGAAQPLIAWAPSGRMEQSSAFRSLQASTA